MGSLLAVRAKVFLYATFPPSCTCAKDLSGIQKSVSGSRQRKRGHLEFQLLEHLQVHVRRHGQLCALSNHLPLSRLKHCTVEVKAASQDKHNPKRAHLSSRRHAGIRIQQALQLDRPLLVPDQQHPLALDPLELRRLQI
jgi:hypothetical protein